MSGIEQIIPWAEQNYDPSEYGSFEDYYSTLAADFASFNRSPLDHILGEQKSIMEEFWTTKPQNVKEFLFNFI